MRVQQATVQRILELAKEHNLTINALAEKSGVADSTLRLTVSPTYGRVKNTGIVTIQKLCQGIGITLEQFFDSPLFKDIDPEP